MIVDKGRSQEKDRKLTCNVTYYPVLRYLISQLRKLHVTLAGDEDHKKVFPDVPIPDGFKSNRNL